MNNILSRNEFLNENKNFKNILTGEEVRDLLLKKAKNSYGKFEYEDVKNLIPYSIEYKLTKLPIELFKDEILDVDINFKNKSNFPPIVNKIDDEYNIYEIVDGKHRISKEYKLGNKFIEVYLGVF